MKRYMAILSCILILLTVCPCPVHGAEERTGLSNQWQTTEGVKHPVGSYFSDKPLDKFPLTIEAWIYLPQSMYEKVAGTVVGNYATQKKDSFTFSIQAVGVPQMRFGYSGGNWTYTLSSAAIPPDTWTHVTMVYDRDSQQIWCYLNGKLKTWTMAEMWFEVQDTAVLDYLCLAGDRREMNKSGFKGILGDVTLYGDIRTPSEILEDAKNPPDLDDPNLLAHYDLDGAQYGQDIPDAGNGGHHMRYEQTWLTQEELDTLWAEDDRAYAYSIAFLPDIQYTTELYPKRLQPVFDYLLENREQKNIQYLISLGDLTNANTDKEWAAISAQTKRLDGQLPYAVIQGNHDVFGTDGQPRFDQYYLNKTDYYRHVEENGGFYQEDSLANTYLLFSAGQVDYLILNLDFGAKDAVLSWADEVLREHADRRVIVVTHGYLHTHGGWLTKDKTYAPSTYLPGLNNGDDMWNKLLKKHENVMLVVSGHISHDHIVHSTVTGDHGNTVHQLLMDPQYTDKLLGGAGIVALMEFTEDGRYARVMYYSTTQQKYFRESNGWIELDFGTWDREVPQEENQLDAFLEIVATPEGTGTVLLICLGAVAAVAVLLLCIRKKNAK